MAGHKALGPEPGTWCRSVASFGITLVRVSAEPGRVTQTSSSFVPVCELTWHLGHDWRRLGLGQGVQEVSHRGREIAGLGVRTATVAISLQDGCGFADRESAAWACQRCRSEVSSGEPGPPRPRRRRRGPTRAKHLLPISCPLAQGGGGGRGLLPRLGSHGPDGHQEQRNQGAALRVLGPGAPVKQPKTGNRGLLSFAHLKKSY